MSVTIFYKGSLKYLENISTLFDTAIERANKFGWSYAKDDVALSIEIPNGEVLLLQPQNGKISGFVKCVDDNNEILEHLFELFYVLKSYFKRLMIEDDFGLWNNYISRFSKSPMPNFRELKDMEKAELKRGFDLPQGYNSVFNINQVQDILMQIICKDMSNDLTKPLNLEKLLSLVDSECGQMLKLDANNQCFQFMAIAETWFLTKLVNKSGIPLKEGKSNGHILFGWFMAEIIFGFGGGSLGSKHQRLRRFVDGLLVRDVDFSNPENFLRLVYSVIEYLGGYRTEAVIIRQS